MFKGQETCMVERCTSSATGARVRSASSVRPTMRSGRASRARSWHRVWCRRAFTDIVRTPRRMPPQTSGRLMAWCNGLWNCATGARKRVASALSFGGFSAENNGISDISRCQPGVSFRGRTLPGKVCISHIKTRKSDVAISIICRRRRGRTMPAAALSRPKFARCELARVTDHSWPAIDEIRKPAGNGGLLSRKFGSWRAA
jgi:hypothetical protein